MIKGRKAIFCARMAALEVGRQQLLRLGTPKQCRVSSMGITQRSKVSKALEVLHKARRNNIAEACGINAEWIVNKLTELHRSCSATYRRSVTMEACAKR